MSYKNDLIMRMIHQVETLKGEMFHVLYPELERFIWDSIDNKSKAGLELSVQQLDEIINSH